MGVTNGLTWVTELTVAEKDLAHYFGNPGVFVFSTPRICDLMESACVSAITDHLDPETISVGTGITMKHLAATPIGLKVTVRALLKSIEGRKLTFLVEVFDEVEKIAEGEHTRAIVTKEKFLEKVNKKKTGKGEKV